MENERIAHFKILREIGRGGFGTVYLAYDEDINEHVALKKIENFSERRHERRGLLYYKKNRENFRYENIISIIETIKIGSDMYYSMPIADGMGGVNCAETNYVPKTLELVIKERLKQGGGWFSEDEILDIIIPIARALATVDKCGLKHRDVKPANIIFVKGKPMLSDFGLAAADTSSLSRAGTADYTPPAWFSDSGGDPDMWGFAMTFFALFSGKPPSESKNNRKYPKCWSEDDIIKNRETWDKFAQIVFRVKNENESERFPNWNALLDALYGLRGYADKREPAEPQPPARKRKLLNGCLALFLAVLICLIGFAIFAGGSGDEGGLQPQEDHSAANPASENKAAAAKQEEKPKAAPENVKLVKDKLNAEIDKRTAKYKKELEETKKELNFAKSKYSEAVKTIAKLGDFDTEEGGSAKENLKIYKDKFWKEKTRADYIEKKLNESKELLAQKEKEIEKTKKELSLEKTKYSNAVKTFSPYRNGNSDFSPPDIEKDLKFYKERFLEEKSRADNIEKTLAENNKLLDESKEESEKNKNELDLVKNKYNEASKIIANLESVIGRANKKFIEEEEASGKERRKSPVFNMGEKISDEELSQKILDIVIENSYDNKVYSYYFFDNVGSAVNNQAYYLGLGWIYFKLSDEKRKELELDFIEVSRGKKLAKRVHFIGREFSIREFLDELKKQFDFNYKVVPRAHSQKMGNDIKFTHTILIY